MLPEQIVLRYIDTWNELDARRRRAAIDRLYAEDCVYTDPLGAVRGRDGVDGFIEAAQKQFPGFLFSLAGKVDAHHGQARFVARRPQRCERARGHRVRRRRARRGAYPSGVRIS